MGGSGFTHYLAKDTGKLVNEADAKDRLFVKVKQQLPSPLKANSGVQYVYSNVTQFDTVEVAHTPVDTLSNGTGLVSPQLKVAKAYIGPQDGLNVQVECKVGTGFEGSDVSALKCGDVEISKIRFSIAVQDEKTLNPEQLSSLSKSEKFLKDMPGSSYLVATKMITLNFGVPWQKKTHVFIASLKQDNQAAYAYGFIKLSGMATLAVEACPAQGAQANFVHEGVQFSNKMGIWKDTSNCWLWTRPETKKVKSADRFKQCPAVKPGETLEHRTLPYYTEFKAAWDRKLVELTKGPAPKLGEDLDKTFWLAGGRVFNGADGSVREVKDVKPNETHNVLCVRKRD